MQLNCFNKNINTDYLKLSKVAYGGEFYYSLRKHMLKDLNTNGTKFKKINDQLLKKINNTSFYSYKNETSGFVATLFENTKTSEIVIAFRGTERIGLGENFADITSLGKDIKTDINLMLGNMDEQFEDAYDFFKLVKAQNPQAKITILGQSLGGALAQIVSAKIFSETKEKIKTFTYNAPGCKHLLETIGCNTKLNYSFITNYAVMNDWCGMFGEKIGELYLIPPIPPKNIKSNTPIEALENVLLTSHEGIFEYTGKVLKKPNNFNQSEGLSLWYFDINNPIRDFEKPSAYINTVFSPVNLQQVQTLGKSIQDKWENFVEEQGGKLQEISSQIQTLTNDFIDEQKDKIMDGINNNTINQISKILDTTFSQITEDSLKKALATLKEMGIDKTHPEYFNSFTIK